MLFRSQPRAKNYKEDVVGPKARSKAVFRAVARSRWLVAQWGMLLVGVALVVLLVTRPAIGLALLWNVIIPIAPALIVVAPGLWRNICPMATVSLLPQALGLARGAFLSSRGVGNVALIGAVALVGVVILRHASLNANGVASAMVLTIAAAAAFGMGIRYEGRSGWCNGLCPIHVVEKLYARAPAVTFRNARCDTCRRCTVPCPDSTPAMTANRSRAALGRWVGLVFTGGFAGFVWGWFQVPDYAGALTLAEAGSCVAWPLGGALVSLLAYWVIRSLIGDSIRARNTLDNLCAAAAVCSYYWYRIPALVGFGEFYRTGLLYDLSSTLPYAAITVARVLTTSFFVWFLVIRPSPRRSWTTRPVTSAA